MRYVVVFTNSPYPKTLNIIRYERSYNRYINSFLTIIYSKTRYKTASARDEMKKKEETDK